LSNLPGGQLNRETIKYSSKKLETGKQIQERRKNLRRQGRGDQEKVPASIILKD
jgi:hypothetical protein